MYSTKTSTRRFDMDKEGDLNEYSAILSDPTCTVLMVHKEKLTDKEFEDGKMVSMHERVVLIVTWEEKVLL